MTNDAREIARKLARVQSRLRQELVAELREHEADLENIFDPYSYSPVVQEVKDKYLSRLYVLHAVLQELAHHNMGHRQPTVQVLSLRAEGSEALVKVVNTQLIQLNGAKVLDIEFVQSRDEDHWVAVISYTANPFTEPQGEAAAFM